jgi:hypothetical protein
MMDHVQVGFEAKQIKRGTRILNSKLNSIPCQPTVIFINHVVAKIGVTFGKQTDSAGGSGPKYYATTRIEFAALGWVKDPKTSARLGQKVKVNIEKLKGGQILFPQFDIVLNNKNGFDKRGSLRDAMIASGFAEKPKGSKVITLLPGAKHEVQIKTTEWDEWVDNQKGGYDAVYLEWRRWAVKEGILKPWGGNQ